ncbi:hypothetical protein MCOR27_004824 [Pyricularia oryzae]|uniref:Allergen Asp f 4 n=2 Tax=Pyricularia TaxID=48558 RepID=A0ABQ8NBW2_PYRGI|nr:hypothetical protein MCOR01_005932 [Pyricularia oryzae]KAI6294579.1 hypothetical protein MCOR33_008330 [Pyricularia grisea]KAI6259917.1 hypothetical protein MCOR19_003741 [Pyricularia oryzae]KAI6280146.1 hypothetical protein MCOR27_004824 [Pyricularia oryzae]KAI6283563.1 hypothetical protein MCOR26_002384 [Pyricularia oryzae]
MHFAPLLVLAAVGASAHPSGHAHLHRRAHERRNPEPKPDPAVGDMVTATIMGKVVSWTNTYDGSPFIKHDQPADVKAAAVEPAPVPTATPSASPPPPPASPASPPAQNSPPPSSSGSGSGTGVTSYTPFCNGQPTVSKRATVANIAYVGNTGTASNWGCNILLVADAQTADQYKYTMKITNQSKDKQICTCFNKIGPTGLIDGFFHQGPTWTMEGQGTQYVAFDDNSQGGCVCNAGDTLRKTPMGQFAGTWIESDFGSSINKGWSGADISAIVPDNYKMQVDGAKVCFAGTCSTVWPGGKHDNAYVGGLEDADGIGLNIPPGKCQLDVQVAFSG